MPEILPLLVARQGAAAAFHGNALFALLMIGLLELAGVVGLALAVGASTSSRHERC